MKFLVRHLSGTPAFPGNYVIWKEGKVREAGVRGLILHAQPELGVRLILTKNSSKAGLSYTFPVKTPKAQRDEIRFVMGAGSEFIDLAQNPRLFDCTLMMSFPKPQSL